MLVEGGAEGKHKAVRVRFRVAFIFGFRMLVEMIGLLIDMFSDRSGDHRSSRKASFLPVLQGFEPFLTYAQGLYLPILYHGQGDPILSSGAFRLVIDHRFRVGPELWQGPLSTDVGDRASFAAAHHPELA